MSNVGSDSSSAFVTSSRSHLVLATNKVKVTKQREEGAWKNQQFISSFKISVKVNLSCRVLAEYVCCISVSSIMSNVTIWDMYPDFK